LNHQLHPLGPDDAGTQAERKARFSGGAPGRSRTWGPRLRRPDETCPGTSAATGVSWSHPRLQWRSVS